MLLSALSFLVVAQSSSEVPEGLTNNPVFKSTIPQPFPRLRSNCLLKLNSELFLCAQVILYRAKKDTKCTIVLCCPQILRCSDDDDGGIDGDDGDDVIVELSSSFCA